MPQPNRTQSPSMSSHSVDDRPRLRHTRHMTARAYMLCLFLLPACGAANQNRITDNSQRRDVIELDTIEIKTDRSTGKPLTYVRDHNALVDQAMAAFHAEHWPECAALFDVLLREYPDAPGAGAIAGLLLILAGSWLSTGGRLPPWRRSPASPKPGLTRA